MRKKIIVIAYTILLAFVSSGCIDWSSIFNQAVPFQEITVDETLFEDKFYYEQLSEEDQLIYKEIYQGIWKMQEKIYLHCDDGEKASSILHNVIFDFPELFWSEGGANMLTYVTGYTVMSPQYVCTKEEKVQKETEIQTAVKQIIEGIPSQYGEYEKIKYIYEYLIENAEYVTDAPDSQNMYSALVTKKTVCAGYAKANQYLLNKLGIYCTYVIGTANGENGMESHAWNIVRCNNQFYYVDITWADPLVKEEDNVPEKNIIYDYLCCNENTLAETHEQNTEYNYPKCTSDDLDYYRLNHMFYETADEKKLLEAMHKSIDAKEDSITFKFANPTEYARGKQLFLEKLISNSMQHLGRKYNLSKASCYYQEDERLNKFSIYWIYE